MERARAETLSKWSGATYVREQERHGHLGSAGASDQIAKTAGAVAGVPRESMLAEKPQERADRCAEGPGA